METEIKELKKELNSCIQRAGAVQKVITATVSHLSHAHTKYNKSLTLTPNKGNGNRAAENEETYLVSAL